MNVKLEKRVISRKHLNVISFIHGIMELKKRGLLIFVFLLILLPGFAINQNSTDTVSAEDEISESPVKWTVLIYMAADNNLEDAAIDDFNELESVGSSDDVNLVVQIDRSSSYDKTNGDWSETRRYFIEPDTDISTINSPVTENLGEVDMSDPTILRDFLLWGVENYPADKYFVVLWDHGLGWSGGVCNDQGRYMPIADVRESLRLLNGQWNHTIDMLGFDACLMGGVEVYYELQDYVNYSFGSGKNEPTDGLPYNDYIRDLVNKPDMTEQELLDEMASDYVRSYRDHSPISVHYAGIDVDAFYDLSLKVNSFVEELERQMPFYLSEILDARNETEEYEKGHSYYYHDFRDFINKLMDRIDNPRFQAVAQDLKDAINDSILAHHGWSVPNKQDDTVANSSGMTIYLPDPNRHQNVPKISSYRTTHFAQETLWDEFLTELFRYNDQAYRESKEPHSSLTYEVEVIDSDSDDQMDSFHMSYNLTSSKDGETSNITLEIQVVNGNGTIVHSDFIDPSQDDGDINFDVSGMGFDHYSFHVFAWDEDEVLQDHISHTHDFQTYGVDFMVTMMDGDGNEIEPVIVKIDPGTNVVLNLKVTNNGNSVEQFQISDSGVPLKYAVDYNGTAFYLAQGEQRIIPFTIIAMDRISPGTDSFHLTATCLGNLSTEESEFITVRVLDTTSDVADELDYIMISILTLMVVSMVLISVLILSSKKPKLTPMDQPELDPEVEELLSFTKNLVEHDEPLIPGTSNGSDEHE